MDLLQQVHQELLTCLNERVNEGEGSIYLVELQLEVDPQTLEPHLLAATQEHPNHMTPYWDDRFLSLLWWLTERAFRDHNNFNAPFWPNWILNAHRPRISTRFDSVQALVRPVENNYNQHFQHVAWPLTQAMIPRCYQTSLVSALYQLNPQGGGDLLTTTIAQLNNNAAAQYLTEMIKAKRPLFRALIEETFSVGSGGELSPFALRVVDALKRSVSEARAQLTAHEIATREELVRRLARARHGLVTYTLTPPDAQGGDPHVTLHYNGDHLHPPIASGQVITVSPPNGGRPVKFWSNQLFGSALPQALLPLAEGEEHDTRPFQGLETRAIRDDALLEALRGLIIQWRPQAQQTRQVKLTRVGLWRGRAPAQGGEVMLIETTGAETQYFLEGHGDAVRKVESSVSGDGALSSFEAWRLRVATLQLNTTFERLCCEVSLSCEACDVKHTYTRYLPGGELLICEHLPELNSLRLEQHGGCEVSLSVRSPLLSSPFTWTLSPRVEERMITLQSLSELLVEADVIVEGEGLDELISSCERRFLGERWRGELSRLTQQRVELLAELDSWYDEEDECYVNTLLWRAQTDEIQGSLTPLRAAGDELLNSRVWQGSLPLLNDLTAPPHAPQQPWGLLLTTSLTWVTLRGMPYNERLGQLRALLTSCGAPEELLLDVEQGRDRLKQLSPFITPRLLYPPSLADALTHQLLRHGLLSFASRAPSVLREVCASLYALPTLSLRDAGLLIALWQRDEGVLYQADIPEVRRALSLCESTQVARVSYLVARLSALSALVNQHIQEAP